MLTRLSIIELDPDAHDVLRTSYGFIVLYIEVVSYYRIR